jgi:hypothetical protein
MRHRVETLSAPEERELVASLLDKFFALSLDYLNQ